MRNSPVPTHHCNKNKFCSINHHVLVRDNLAERSVPKGRELLQRNSSRQGSFEDNVVIFPASQAKAMHWNCSMKSSRNLKKGSPRWKLLSRQAENNSTADFKQRELLYRERRAGWAAQWELSSSTSSAQNLRVHQWLNHKVICHEECNKNCTRRHRPTEFQAVILHPYSLRNLMFCHNGGLHCAFLIKTKGTLGLFLKPCLMIYPRPQAHTKEPPAKKARQQTPSSPNSHFLNGECNCACCEGCCLVFERKQCLQQDEKQILSLYTKCKRYSLYVVSVVKRQVHSHRGISGLPPC